jgi:hypothetical protein
MVVSQDTQRPVLPTPWCCRTHNGTSYAWEAARCRACGSATWVRRSLTSTAPARAMPRVPWWWPPGRPRSWRPAARACRGWAASLRPGPSPLCPLGQTQDRARQAGRHLLVGQLCQPLLQHAYPSARMRKSRRPASGLRRTSPSKASQSSEQNTKDVSRSAACRAIARLGPTRGKRGARRHGA